MNAAVNSLQPVLEKATIRSSSSSNQNGYPKGIRA